MHMHTRIDTYDAEPDSLAMQQNRVMSWNPTTTGLPEKACKIPLPQQKTHTQFTTDPHIVSILDAKM